MNEIDFTLELDDCGYPTDETLDSITLCAHQQIPDLLYKIKDIWAYNSYDISSEPPKDISSLVDKYDQKDTKTWIRMATIGWSGNESIIAALEKNPYHYFYWFASVRGGLHIYCIPNV